MKPQLEVFQIGSPVYIGDHIEATILAISIYEHNRVSYQVAWWNGNTRNSEWLEQHEINATTKSPTMRIGFTDYFKEMKTWEAAIAQEKKED